MDHFPEILIEAELCSWLRIEHNPSHVAYLRQRRGLPSITFNPNGQPEHRYPLSEVREWVRLQVSRKKVKHANT